MNILQVTLGFYPAEAWGGPVKIVYQNSRELIRRGHQVTVCCSNLFDKHRKISRSTTHDEIEGIHVIYFNTWNIPFWPGTLGPVWMPDLSSFIQQNLSQYDIIHLNGYRNLINLPFVAGAEKYKIPLVLQPHGTLPVIVNTYFLKKFYDLVLGRRELNTANAMIVGQASERLQAISIGYPESKTVTIPNGIDLATYSALPDRGQIRKKYGIPENSPVILFLARINRKKGADMLVRAFSKLEVEGAFLVLAGPDDGQLNEVNQLIKELQLQEKVIITGLLTGEEVKSAFVDADIFVLPCRKDTFPFAIIEACALGRPMVITDQCEIAGLLDGLCATVTPFDENQFALAMTELLVDHQKYLKYQRNCNKVLQDSFSIHAVVDQLEQLYTRVVEGRL